MKDPLSKLFFLLHKLEYSSFWNCNRCYALLYIYLNSPEIHNFKPLLVNGVSDYLTPDITRTIFATVKNTRMLFFYYSVATSLRNFGKNLSRDMTKPTKWLCTQPRVRSTWASAQSDQSLRCPREESMGP